MKRYTDVVISASTGKPVIGASVAVYITGTNTLATIYSGDGINPTTNPLITDSNGRFAFYVADGRYDLTISGGGIVSAYTILDQEIADVTQSSGGSDLNWAVNNLTATTLASTTSTTGSLTATSVSAGTGTFTGLTSGNCVQASTGGLLVTVGGPCGTSSGTVTTTGSPVSGNLTKFSGASSITNGDLSGDVTTAGTLAATIANPISGARTGSGLWTFNSGITGTGSVGALTVPPANITAGTNGQCLNTTGGVTQWGSCAGTAGVQLLNLSTTILSVNAATTSVQSFPTIYTFGAGQLNSLGKTFSMEMTGYFSLLNNTITVTPSFSFVGGGWSVMGTSNLGTSATTGFYTWRTNCTTTATGTNGNITCSGPGLFQNASGATSYLNTYQGNLFVSPVNLTVTQAIAASISFSSASSSNVGYQYQLYIWQHN